MWGCPRGAFAYFRVPVSYLSIWIASRFAERDFVLSNLLLLVPSGYVGILQYVVPMIRPNH